MRDFPSSIMIFAAGFGTRMGALTRDKPKPMIEVAGQPLIDHALARVDAFGQMRVVVNLHYKPAMLRAHLKHRHVLFSEEHPEILETGGGLRAALPLLGKGPVFTMNSDAIWYGPNPLEVLAAQWQPKAMDALLLCIPPGRAVGHAGEGDFIAEPEKPANRGPGLIYTGLQILKTDDLSQFVDNAFSLNVVWDRMLARDRLHVAAYPGQWCDVGHPEGIALAEAMIGGPHV
jgi:MurNAc alpha-1-phosphate uridylyltransferase